MNTKYTAKEKMGVLVTRHPGLLLSLSHFRIPLGFGEKTIEQVCREHDIDTDFFMLVVNVYTIDNYVPSLETLHETPMDALIPYLRHSHAYYLEKRMPHIGHHLDKLAQMLPKKVATAVKNFYEQYLNEVKAHFLHEERDVFPHIEQLLTQKPTTGFTIDHFIDAHGNLEDKLSDLTQIIFKYLPEADDNYDNVNDMIFDILSLAHDLHKHSLIEEKVMVPYIKHLEKSAKA